jgi:hypothetical protein
MAWARGYAQYGGGPISNVVANRHVELAANGAALETQRAVFGRADPGGRAGLARGTARVGLTDALAGSGVGGQEWVDYVLGNGDPPSGSIPGHAAAASGGLSPSGTTTVEVNHTADVATYDLLAGGTGERRLDAFLDDAYAVDVRLATDVQTGYSEPRSLTEPAGDGWELNDTSERTSYEVADGTASAPAAGNGWHELATYRRVVLETTVAHREWTRENETATTVDRWSTRYRVGLRVVGIHRSEPGRFVGLYEVCERREDRSPRLAVVTRERAVVGRLRDRCRDIRRRCGRRLFVGWWVGARRVSVSVSVSAHASIASVVGSSAVSSSLSLESGTGITPDPTRSPRSRLLFVFQGR